VPVELTTSLERRLGTTAPVLLHRVRGGGFRVVIERGRPDHQYSTGALLPGRALSRRQPFARIVVTHELGFRISRYRHGEWTLLPPGQLLHRPLAARRIRGHYACPWRPSAHGQRGLHSR